MGFNVIEVDGRRYIDIDEYCAHLLIASETVMAFTSEASPNGAMYVSETLNTTRQSLLDAKAQLDH